MKKLLFFSAIVLTSVCVQAQIEDVSVYDDCTKNGYTKVVGRAPDKAEKVDLGLSVKWANMNVGATCPEEWGENFAWGELSRKWVYDWTNYKYCNGNMYSMTKYCVDSKYGTVDNKTILDKEDDVASINWGGDWRMPTYAEIEELCTNCTMIWTEDYKSTGMGLSGYIFTSNKPGYTDKSIFLPAESRASSRGFYWTSSLSENQSSAALCLTIRYLEGYLPYVNERYSGCSVRPVCDYEELKTVNILLYTNNCDSVNTITCQEGQQLRIFAETSLEGSYFVKWSDGNTNNPRIITANQDSSFTAIFKKIGSQETVKCAVVNESPYGTVKVTGNIVKDSTISLEAVAPECSKFVKWSDNDTSNPRNLTVTQDSTLTAIFEKIQFKVSVDTDDAKKGAVDVKNKE